MASGFRAKQPGTAFPVASNEALWDGIRQDRDFTIASDKPLALSGRLMHLGPVQRRWLRVFIALAFVAMFCAWLLRWQRERRYDPIILSAARRYGVDPALVKAVIWRESRFNANARGAVGEIGLMQVRDAAAHEWAAAEKRTGFNERHLAEPDTNIFAGTWYLAQLLKRYRHADDPVPYALADYNAGRTHVLRWMRGTAKTNSTELLAKMDFPGTRGYIAAVRERREQYRSAFQAGR